MNTISFLRDSCIRTHVALTVALLGGLLQTAVSSEGLPSELARGAFQGDGGFSFRVEFAEEEIVFKRTMPDLPLRGEGMPAWMGEAYDLFRVSPGPGAKRIRVERNAWEHHVGVYGVSGGEARVVLSRLTPAVLIDSPSRTVVLRNRAPTRVAFLSGGVVVSRNVEEIPEKPALDEPWVLAWFGKATPYRNYPEVADLDDEHTGADKVSLGKRRPANLDMPLLFRLEHKPKAIRSDGSAVALEFEERAGKVAVMPLFGGKGLSPEETEEWTRQLPDKVIEQCRLWSQRLRDYPLSVKETFAVDAENDVLSIGQEFTWESFRDDWGTPPVKAAAVPPMLGLALGGGVPVTFHQDGREVQPVDYNLMDTPGKEMGIEGADSYEYRIRGLSEYLLYQRKPATLARETEHLRTKLEKHIREMVDAGHLAPLFYVYGGIGSDTAAYFYWSSSADLAKAMRAAFPCLSENLRQRVREYLKEEWKIAPPFQVNTDSYMKGANRAPYEMPWEEMNLVAAWNREKALRQSRLFGDLYGVHAYMMITGERPDATAMKQHVGKLASELLRTQDWALCGPVKPRIARGGFFDPYSYYRRNGQSTYNSWLAGAIGMVRLAREFGWKEEEELGWYLFGKLAIARIGQARYTAELHRLGLVRGDEKEDWRTLVHIDRETAIVLRGSVFSVVREDQEIPPFIDLVEEVGRLLGKHAREECRIYLDNLDESMPLWWISEAPKQSASEQRLCPLQHKSGNVLAQYWVLGKRREDFRRYVDTTRFKGDFYYTENLAALIDSYAEEGGR